jgi:hypothetical protein
MDLRSSLLKMEKSYKNKGTRLLLYLFLLSIGLIFPFASSAERPELTNKPLENEIMQILARSIKCKNIVVQVRLSKENPNEIKTLAVKVEGAMLGGIVADYVTVVYEKPIIDFNQLKKAKKFKIISSSGSKAGILISKKAIERYIAGKVKKQVRISIRFSPPYAECFFDIPVSEIPPETMKLLHKYVKGKKLEGYAAIQVKAKDNALSVLSSKVIVNHFLIPDAIRQGLQNSFKQSERIGVLSPLRYSINNVTVQNNYIFLTN